MSHQRARFRIWVGLSVLALSASAFAHDTFMLPKIYPSASPAIVSLTSGRAFPKLEFGPQKDRVVMAAVSGPHAGATFAVASESPTALNFALQAALPGAYLAVVALAPREIDLPPDKVAAYFDDIAAPQSLRDRYAAMPEPRQWRETYTKYAKAALCVSACSAGMDLARVSGMHAEIVAVGSTLKSSTPSFGLMVDGDMLSEPNVAIALVRADGVRTLLRTNDQGLVALPSGLKGPILLSAVLVTPPKAPGGRFTSDFVSFTFDAALLSR